MRAVLVVRDGVLPMGGDEAVAECGGRALLVGSGTREAAAGLSGVAGELALVEAGAFAPQAWAAALAPHLAADDVVLLPASPDGRDLAPLLAAALERPLLAQATRVEPRRVELARMGGLELHTVVPTSPFVATLQPGVRLTEPRAGEPPTPAELEVSLPVGGERDALVVDVLPADAATIDLAEAPRILGGGAGLDGAARFAQLAELAAALGASVGATRVITDRGWIAHDRQIGTTGVVVDPRLYVAFGVSGAVQHTSGLGRPDHVISVNTDPHCPMMQMADLAVVADANEVLEELLALLVWTSPAAPTPRAQEAARG